MLQLTVSPNRTHQNHQQQGRDQHPHSGVEKLQRNNEAVGPSGGKVGSSSSSPSAKPLCAVKMDKGSVEAIGPKLKDNMAMGKTLAETDSAAAGTPTIKKAGKKIKRKTTPSSLQEDGSTSSRRSKSPPSTTLSSMDTCTTSSSRPKGDKISKKKKQLLPPPPAGQPGVTLSKSSGQGKKRISGLEKFMPQQHQQQQQPSEDPQQSPTKAVSSKATNIIDRSSKASTTVGSKTVKPSGRPEPAQRSVQRSKSSNDAIDFLASIEDPRTAAVLSTPKKKKKSTSLREASSSAMGQNRKNATTTVPATAATPSRPPLAVRPTISRSISSDERSSTITTTALASSCKRQQLQRTVSNPTLFMVRGSVPIRQSDLVNSNFTSAKVSPSNPGGGAGGRRATLQEMKNATIQSRSPSPIVTRASVAVQGSGPKGESKNTTVVMPGGSQRNLSVGDNNNEGTSSSDGESSIIHHDVPIAHPPGSASSSSSGSGRGRPAPSKRGVLRIASDPTSFRPPSIREGRRAVLQPINEEKVIRKPSSMKNVLSQNGQERPLTGGKDNGGASASSRRPNTTRVPSIAAMRDSADGKSPTRRMTLADRATSMRNLTSLKGNGGVGDGAAFSSEPGSAMPSRKAGNRLPNSVREDESTSDELGLRNISRKIPERTRSDDLSSMARSTHEHQQRRGRRRSNSVDIPWEPPNKPPPQGILRNSSHHGDTRSRTISPAPGRRGIDVEAEQGTVSPSGTTCKPASFSLPVAFTAIADVFYSGDKDDSSFVEEEDIKFQSRPKKRPGLQRGFSFGNMNFSTHSLQSTRSQLSIDKEVFEDDPPWKKVLRYLQILPPHKNEKPLKRNIRVFTWAVLFLDFVGALVAISTYDGTTACCGVPIFDLIVNINWDTCFRVVTYLYLLVVLAEVIPVVRKGLPFNLLNPTLGFAITFAMFFDDSVAQAVTMWILEALSIFFEFLVYRSKATIYRATSARLSKADTDLANLKKSQRNILAASKHSRSPGINSSRLQVVIGPNDCDDDDDSLSGNSFGGIESNRSLDCTTGDDDPTKMTNSSSGSLELPSGGQDDPVRVQSLSPSARTSGTMVVPTRTKFNKRGRKPDELGFSAHTMASMMSHAPLPWERKHMRLLRERRILRQQHQQEKVELRFHLIGTCINGGLLLISLILIITIASTGGLCLYHGTAKVFSMNQLGKCNQCIGTSGVCQVCNADGNNQCYYPYY